MEHKKPDTQLQLHILFSEILYFTSSMSNNRGINGFGAFEYHANQVAERIPEWIKRYEKIVSTHEANQEFPT